MLDNPNDLNSIFTRLFGVHLMRYYDEKASYRVIIDGNADTSYMNSHDKIIGISLRNIAQLLKANVSVLSVAYHELAHVLYTSDNLRDRIRKLTVEKLCHDPNAPFSNTKYKNNREFFNVIEQLTTRVHSVWNVLEDERIERITMSQFPFLTSILDPLKKTITEDGKIMTWRKGKYASQVAPANLVPLCEEFSQLTKRQKQLTAKDASQVIYDIILQFYPNVDTNIQDDKEIQEKYEGDKSQPQSEGNPTPSDNHDESDDNDSDDGEQDADDELDSEDELDSDEDGDEDADEDGDDDSDDAFEEPLDEEDKDGKSSQNAKDDLRKIENMETQDNQETAIIEMLKDIKREEIRNIEIGEYNYAVKEDVKSPVSQKQNTSQISKIPNIVNISQEVRNGMTAAQRKKYSIDPSNKISVPRIVEAMSSRRQPNVFSNKGKDVSYLKKVVVFEDISGSTNGMISSIFSAIAKALTSSFVGSEWWLYADKLVKKHKLDYEFYSQDLRYSKDTNKSFEEYQVGGGTSARNLLHVMRKYRNEQAVFIIITDGDIYDLFSGQNEDIYKEFKDKTLVVGLLDDDIKLKMPHNFDITVDITKIKRECEKIKDEYKKKSQGNYDFVVMHRLMETHLTTQQMPSIVSKCVYASLPIVKGNLK